MYVPVNGLGAIRRRRGFGDTVVTDPVTGEQKVIMSAPITTENVYASGAPSTYVDSAGNVTLGSPQTLTAWLNANSTMVAVGAAGFVALLLFARAGR